MVKPKSSKATQEEPLENNSGRLLTSCARISMRRNTSITLLATETVLKQAEMIASELTK